MRPRKTPDDKSTETPAEAAESKTVLTSNEAAIAARVMAERDDWKAIKESDIEDFRVADDPLAFPSSAQEMRKKKRFAFRWIARTAERMDEIRTKEVPFKWWVCNEVNTPFLKGFFDPVLGCVCKMDQALVFKPFWMFVKEQEFKTKSDRAVQGDYLKQKQGEVRGGGEFVVGQPINAGATAYPVDVESLVEERTGIKPVGEGFSDQE